jgi:hypothetical protein
MATAKSVRFPQFYYWRNRDNSIDAICGDCFLIAATADTETELQERASAHVCNPDEIPARMSGSTHRAGLQPV